MGGDGVRDVRSFFYGRLGAGAVGFQCEEVSAFSKTKHGVRVCSRNFPYFDVDDDNNDEEKQEEQKKKSKEEEEEEKKQCFCCPCMLFLPAVPAC